MIPERDLHKLEVLEKILGEIPYDYIKQYHCMNCKNKISPSKGSCGNQVASKMLIKTFKTTETSEFAIWRCFERK